MDGRRRGPRLLGLVIGLAALADAASAREATARLSIPEQPREAALMALGRQAGLSLGFAPGVRCGGRAGVKGLVSVARALDELLAGSACIAVRPDARTIVIRARPAAAPTAFSLRPEPSPPPNELSLEEVVVTADKTESLLSAAPYGLTAVSGRDLERQGVRDVGDLSLLAAGVTVTNLGPGRDKVILRGLSDGPLTGRTQSTVGLYLGELRLTYNAPDPDLPLIDITRVEVLRGPQGSLYGAGSIGGVLQLTPNTPDPSGRSGRLLAGLSATRRGGASYQLEGTLNLPLPGPDAALRAVAWSERAGGYIDNPQLAKRNIDRSRRTGARVAAHWRLAPDWTLDTTLIDQAITTRNAHYAEPAVGRLARARAVEEPHDNDFLALGVTLGWTPSWARLSLSMGAISHAVGTTYDASGAGALRTSSGLASFSDDNRTRSLIGEARLGSVGAGRARWTVGAFAALSDQRLAAALAPFQGPADYSESRRDRLRESAVFGEAAYDLTSVLTLTVGGRFFSSHLETHSAVQAGPTPRAFTGEAGDSGFAPKLLLAYRPTAGVTAYLQAAEGYRTTGFNTAGPAGQTFAAAGSEPLRRYGGDELWSYEAGVRWRAPALGLALRAALFQARWKDIQANLVLPSGLPFTANLGDGQSRGVEAEASYSRGGLTMSANIVRQSPELDRPSAALIGESDSRLPGVPELSYAGSSAYELPLKGAWSLRLSAGYAYVGHSRLALDPVRSQAMGGYSDLRLSAGLRRPGLSLRLTATNALDRRGDTLAFGNPFFFRTRTQSTPQRPRTLGIEIARDF